jgi:penicillin-binding protein 1A
MGRDDARAVPGLHGGSAPAQAFHDFMISAVAKRPVQQFETQVPMPDWQLTPEEEIYGDQSIDANGIASMVDENGMPIGTLPPDQQPYPQPIVIGPDGRVIPNPQQQPGEAFPPQQQQQQQLPPSVRVPQYPQQQPPRQMQRPPSTPPQRQPPPGSTPPPDEPQPRPYAA